MRDGWSGVRGQQRRRHRRPDRSAGRSGCRPRSGWPRADRRGRLGRDRLGFDPEREALCDELAIEIFPATISALTSSISALNERGTPALIVPRPTPPFWREKREVRPVSSVPRASSSIVSNTATSSLSPRSSVCAGQGGIGRHRLRSPRSHARLPPRAPRDRRRWRPGTRLAIPSRSGSGRPTCLSPGRGSRRYSRSRS